MASLSSSPVSYKSTHSSRSSVLERAREYNRRIDEQKGNFSNGFVGANQSFNDAYQKSSHYYDRRRSKSLERGSEAAGSIAETDSTSHPRSQSAGRAAVHRQPPGVAMTSSPTRNRAMASVQKPTASSSSYRPVTGPPADVRRPQEKMGPPAHQSHRYTGGSLTPQPSNPPSTRVRNVVDTPTKATTHPSNSSSRMHPNTNGRNSALPKDEKKDEAAAPAGGPVVTPELLVDALSGHEDGLLAIAEKLMEHYDSGYDVMGEAIIDAFADVQKLFQHVVEAAHMEGAAFEAARRDEEQKQRQKDGRFRGDSSVVASEHRNPATPSSPSGPTRHDEFIDQDVKDVLADAIRKGSTLRNERKDVECYHLYTTACQDASSLLPVDSDHRGRLQLSIARAESMSPDRACAILRYAMDDVLRSGLQAHHPTPIPDPSNRADVVLNRNMTTSNNAVVQQSPDEALASLMEELKEILQAPIYHDTPLQHVASRFWAALSESQKIQHRNESRLEQNLGKLKGEFLLARAEWEEKLNQSNANAESYKKKYERLLQSDGSTERSRSFTAKTNEHDDSNSHQLNYNNIDLSSVYGSVKSAASKAETVASGVSGFAQHARSLVMNSGFNCVAPASGGRNDVSHDDDDDINTNDDSEFDSNPPRPHGRGRSTQERSRSRPKTAATSQNSRFQEYSRSPHRVDI